MQNGLNLQETETFESWLAELGTRISIEWDEGFFVASVPALAHVWGFRSVFPTDDQARTDLFNTFSHVAVQMLETGDVLPGFLDNPIEDYCD